MDCSKEKELKIIAARMRKLIIEGTYNASSGHPGGSLSCTEIVASLYFNNIMKVDPENPGWEDRDRFVLSKGHAAPALYAALAIKGFFPEEDIRTLRKIDSYLEGHPNMKIPGVDMSTGSLGQGISAAVGMAIAGKLDKKDYTVYSIMGDGETQEGQVWEAMMSSAHYKLDNLIAFLDLNGLQIDGKTDEVMSLGNVEAKFKAFGLFVQRINGHDLSRIEDAVKKAKEQAEKKTGMPSIIICDTVKGKDVSFMEGKAEWHGVAPKADQRDIAYDEIDAVLRKLEG